MGKDRSSQSVFELIHELHSTVSSSIDTALSWDQLNAPPINYTLIRPIISRFSLDVNANFSWQNVSGQNELLRPGSSAGPFTASSSRDRPRLGPVLYALMVNRVQFITLSANDLSSAGLQASRAAFCEILAMKLIRSYPDQSDEVELVEALVHGHCAFEGAAEEVWNDLGEDRKEMEETKSSALELAILSSSKHLLSLPIIQHLINQIYLGNLIYLPVSSKSLIADSYISERTIKRRQASHSSFNSTRPLDISVTPASGSSPRRKDAHRSKRDMEVFVYDPYEAGWLDHQRLKVPKWRTWMEALSFVLLVALFIATLSYRDIHHLTIEEAIFIVYTMGFMLDEFAASKEHGWTIYAANAWNAFDLAYIMIFLLYLALRIFALATGSPTTSDLAFDILACGACILFPRLVFFLIRDHVVIIALRAMISKFLGFMGLTFLAFSGICFCLWTLGRSTWTVKQIIWLMLQIWFGSSYLGFSASESFHPIFGPIILISYAALCNILLITILIAILSNTFADINNNAQEEHLFNKVVKTFEGVKSDAIFSYLPPTNLLAIIILTPLSWVCSPRMLHRINVFAIRTTNFPILFGISVYERYRYRAASRSVRLQDKFSSGGMTKAGLFDSWLAGDSEAMIASVFEAAPPRSKPSELRPQVPNSVASSSDEESAGPQRLGPNSRLDSPLAKLFGKRSATIVNREGVQRSSKGSNNKPDTDLNQGTASEVTKLKAELADVRASQLRMEEMLGKILSGVSGTESSK